MSDLVKIDATTQLSEAKKLSNELVGFVDQNKLAVYIAGKRYLQVEAWQFAGALLGTTPVVQYTKDISDESNTKYKVKVNIIDSDNRIVSTGFAICSNKESKKRSFDEYAIASMAQTRAIGKAYRNYLAWIVKLSGYEATPAEEIDKDSMEGDLLKYKQDVLKAFKEAGITKSSEMIAIIQKSISKDVIESADDALEVIAELTKEES